GKGSGKCSPTSKCSGTSTPGYCPGPSDVQCCTSSSTTGVGDSCSVNGVSGVCQLTSTACSGGEYAPGYCQGPSNVQCCTKGSSSGGGSGCGTPTVNAAGISLIKTYEGFVPTVSADPVGYPTVGYGHKCQKANCAEVTEAGYTFPLTKATASELLMSDLKGYGACLAQYCPKCTLNANQYAALVSWTMNIGCSQMESSTLIKDLNAGDNVDSTCASQLPQWDQSKGGVLPGLVNRRAAEVKLCQTATETGALPEKC
ncbi:lysozyme-like protein, partial [Rhizodiscina lignyota]